MMHQGAAVDVRPPWGLTGYFEEFRNILILLLPARQVCLPTPGGPFLLQQIPQRRHDFFLFLNFTPGLLRKVLFLPTSLTTRVGKGFPLGEPRNVTVSPLFGPLVIFLVCVFPFPKLLFLGITSSLSSLPPRAHTSIRIECPARSDSRQDPPAIHPI